MASTDLAGEGLHGASSRRRLLDQHGARRGLGGVAVTAGTEQASSQEQGREPEGGAGRQGEAAKGGHRGDHDS
jgi:hypothetical protein